MFNLMKRNLTEAQFDLIEETLQVYLEENYKSLISEYDEEDKVNELENIISILKKHKKNKTWAICDY